MYLSQFIPFELKDGPSDKKWKTYFRSYLNHPYSVSTQ
jgi:hypothetical protein